METEQAKPNFEKLMPILQSEYQALKSEQTYRINIRENAFISNFLAIGVVASISFSSKPINMTVLLLVPLISSCICWVYLNNDMMVSKLRIYFTEEFPEKVLEVLNKETVIFSKQEVLHIIASWEHYHRKKDKFRKLRKVLNTLFVFLGFVVISISSLAVTVSIVFTNQKENLWVWLFDLILSIIILISLIITKDW